MCVLIKTFFFKLTVVEKPFSNVQKSKTYYFLYSIQKQIYYLIISEVLVCNKKNPFLTQKVKNYRIVTKSKQKRLPKY